MSESDVGGRRRRHLRLGAALAPLFPLGITVVAAACSNDPGALVVSVDSNVPLPGYIDSFVLEATVNGVTMFGEQFYVVDGVPISASQTQLPGTLAVVNSGSAGDPITVRLLGISSSQSGTAQASSLREVTTTVPSSGTSLLRLSLDALCYGEAYTFPTGAVDPTFVGASVEAAATAVGSCGPEQTCVAGGCVQRAVTTVPYVADPASDAGTCFPVATCFDDAPENEVGFETIATNGDCTVPVPLVTGSGGALVPATQDQLNIGVPLPIGDCSSGVGTCLAPLDSVSQTDDPITGFWSDGTLVHLPAGLCAPTAGIPRHSVVEVSTACAAKTVDHPLCAPDTRVATKEPTGNGASSPDGANSATSYAGTVLSDGGVAMTGTGMGSGPGTGTSPGTGTGPGTDGGNGGSDSGGGSGGDDDSGSGDDGGEQEGGQDGGGGITPDSGPAGGDSGTCPKGNAIFGPHGFQPAGCPT